MDQYYLQLEKQFNSNTVITQEIYNTLVDNRKSNPEALQRLKDEITIGTTKSIFFLLWLDEYNDWNYNDSLEYVFVNSAREAYDKLSDMGKFVTDEANPFWVNVYV